MNSLGLNFDEPYSFGFIAVPHFSLEDIFLLTQLKTIALVDVLKRLSYAIDVKLLDL